MQVTKASINRCRKSTAFSTVAAVIAIVIAAWFGGVEGFSLATFIALVGFIAGGGSMFLLMFDKEAK